MDNTTVGPEVEAPAEEQPAPAPKPKGKPGPKPKGKPGPKPKTAAAPVYEAPTATVVSAPAAEPRKGRAPALHVTDEAIDWSKYNPRPQGQQSLPLRDDFDPTGVKFRYFRHDQMNRLDGRIQNGGWIPVTIGGSVNGIFFTEMFVPETDPAYPFDENGYIPKGNDVIVQGGERRRELYLAARPAVASVGEQALRAKLSAAKLDPQGVAGGASAQNQGSIIDPLTGQRKDISGTGSLNVPSANPAEPYAKPVQSAVSMSHQMVTSEKWAGIDNK
jgi:hypothetical protein